MNNEKLNEVDKDVVQGCLINCILLVVLLATPVIHGYTLLLLWGWFAVPIGAPVINLLDATGLALIAKFLDNSGETDASDTVKIRSIMTKALLKPPCFIAMGYAIITVM
jgi:hypothetical protein